MKYYRNHKTWYNTAWRSTDDDYSVQLVTAKVQTHYQVWNSGRSYHGLRRLHLDRFEFIWDLRDYYTKFHVLNDD